MSILGKGPGKHQTVLMDRSRPVNQQSSSLKNQGPVSSVKGHNSRRSEKKKRETVLSIDCHKTFYRCGSRNFDIILKLDCVSWVDWHYRDIVLSFYLERTQFVDSKDSTNDEIVLNLTG